MHQIFSQVQFTSSDFEAFGFFVVAVIGASIRFNGCRGDRLNGLINNNSAKYGKETKMLRVNSFLSFLPFISLIPSRTKLYFHIYLST